jgi:serine/threonine protein kinase
MTDVPTRIGPYAIDSRLGAGGMAETFVATRNMQGIEQRVCVKRILPAYAANVDARRLFGREANISAKLRHANLVTILDVGEDSGMPYLVMELVEGSDLGAILERAPGKKLPPDLVAFVLAEMAHGLHEAHGGGGAHAGVVHRDLSPSNVLVSTMGEVKVADFGIAKALSGEKATATLMRGKFAYMAPEQLDGASLDPRADFFALGVMGYEMVAGVRPFDAEHDARLVMQIAKNERRPLIEVAPDAPKDLVDTIEALLSPKREERPPDGHAIVERLAPVVPPSMIARRKLGALAKAALAARLEATSKEPTRPDADSSLQAFAATIAMADAPRAEIRRTRDQAPAVGPVGTNPSLGDTLESPTLQPRGRSPALAIAAAAAVLLALLGGGAYLFSMSPAVEAPATVEAPPVATAPAAPAPTTPPAPTMPTTPPIAVTPPPVIAVAPVVEDPPPPADSHRTAPRTGRRSTPPAPTTPTTPSEPSTAEASAELSFIVAPWGNIWVDRRYYGRAPVSVPVDPGTHTVQAGFDTPQATRTIRVRPGQHQRVEFELDDP